MDRVCYFFGETFTMPNVVTKYELWPSMLWKKLGVSWQWSNTV